MPRWDENPLKNLMIRAVRGHPGVFFYFYFICFFSLTVRREGTVKMVRARSVSSFKRWSTLVNVLPFIFNSFDIFLFFPVLYIDHGQ